MAKHENGRSNVRSIAIENTSCIRRWNEIIAEHFFHAECSALSREHSFNGQVQSIEIADLRLSLLRSSPVSLVRDKTLSHGDNHASFAVLAPIDSEVELVSKGFKAKVTATSFAVQSGSMPIEIRFATGLHALVLKGRTKQLEERLWSLGNLLEPVFEENRFGVKLFLDHLRSTYENYTAAEAHGAPTLYYADRLIADQLLDLLTMTIDAGESWRSDSESSVRRGHLKRVTAYIEERISDSHLSVGQIAKANGLSTRYLHSLFSSMDTTVWSWIKEKRLQKCYEALTDHDIEIETFGELALAWGFSDQPSFNRAFRSKYKLTPKQVRKRALEKSEQRD